MNIKKLNAALITCTVLLGTANTVFADTDIVYSDRSVYENISGNLTVSNTHYYSTENKQGIKHKVIFIPESDRVSIDETYKDIDEPPYISGGRTMLPLRAVTEILKTFENNVSINWNSADKKAVIIYKDKQVVFTVYSDVYTVNGKEIEMTDGVSEIKNNRIFIPIRELINAMDLNISWNDKSKEIIITN